MSCRCDYFFSFFPSPDARCRHVFFVSSSISSSFSFAELTKNRTRKSAERTEQSKRRLSAGGAWQNENNLVFTNELGRHYAIFTFYKNFKRIAASIGRPDARPHDLRHTAATVAIASGADIKSVQDLLGHATASFTLDRYAHTSERMMKDTAQRMQDYYSTLETTKKS